MSFFSSLCLVYPGKPPLITTCRLREFSGRLREIIPFQSWLQGVELKYGKAISRDMKSTNLFKQILPNMFQSVSYEWDHQVQISDCHWNDLWPLPKQDSKSVYRAHITFGGLPREIGTELTAIHQANDHRFIAPDMASFNIDPFSPAALDDEEERDIYGFLSLNFSGNGYFSWREQPFDAYWQQVRENPTLKQVLQLCREGFTVPPLPNIKEIKTNLGPLFLNRDEYREGDWIVSVVETG